MNRTLDSGFLPPPETTPCVQRLYDDDIERHGYVMNLSRVWAHHPALLDALSDLLGQCVRAASLSFRQRGILVAATAAAFGDPYCSLAWGTKLAAEAGADLAAAVLRGDDTYLDTYLDEAERALARWARRVARDPNATEATDIEPLRHAGYDDAQIVAITVFIALRLGFSTVNDALGAPPDAALVATAPTGVRDAVTFGRPLRAPSRRPTC